jgi:hypothetical protein
MTSELSSSPWRLCLDTKTGSSALRSNLRAQTMILSYWHLVPKTLQFGCGTSNLLSSTRQRKEATSFSMPSKHRWEIWAEGEEGGRQISLKRHIVSVKDPALPGDTIQKYSITFDALLVGHESGVTSLSWRPGGPTATSPVLLSTSTDSSLILWSPFDSLWVNRNRFGDIGGQRLGGFVGGLWNTNGEEILAWGWNGGWRRWRHDATHRGGRSSSLD